MSQRRIFKYVLCKANAKPGVHRIQIEKGAQLLSVGVQGNDIVVWAIVNPESPRDYNRFYLAWTGFSLPDEVEACQLVGRVEEPTLGLIAHIFNLEDTTCYLRPEGVEEYATAEQKEEIIRLLNHPCVLRAQKTKTLLNINRVDVAQANKLIQDLSRQVLNSGESKLLSN